MDNKTFSELVTKHQDSLLSHIKLYVSDAEQANDILQVSIQKAYTSLEKYDPTYNFSTWLFTIAKNTAIDHLRKNTIPIVNTKDDELILNIPDSKYTPEQKMVFSQDYDQLVKYIKGLPEPYNHIAELRFIKEFAYEEIAQELEMPLNTVRTRLRKAKELLSELIDQDEFRNNI